MSGKNRPAIATMDNELSIGAIIEARIVAIQSYGLILERDGKQIVVLAADIVGFDRRSELYRVGDLESVHVVRRNEKTGQYVGEIE